jgi:hypothetical protein
MSCCFRDIPDGAPFAFALSLRPSLKRISFDFVEDFTDRTTRDRDACIEIATYFLNTNTLEELTLYNVPQSIPAQEILLRVKPNLKKLDLEDTWLSNAELQECASLIGQPDFPLEELDLGRSESGTSLMPLALGLRKNTKLRWLRLRYRGLLSPPSDKEMDAFLVLLESHNFTLEILDVFGSDRRHKDYDKLQFFLKLNRDHQRKRLMGPGEPHVNQEEWINVINSAKEDVSVVFYYLSQNPSLLNVASA